MEIKQVKDLVPYRASLRELWAREEFQPVLAWLSSLRQEAFENIGAIDFKEPAESVKTKAAIEVQRLKDFSTMLYLPTQLEAIVQQEERIKDKMQKYQASQEGAII